MNICMPLLIALGYMCQINTNPMKYSIGYLDVLTAPSFDETQSNSDVVESEGSNVTLSCKANGYPAPVSNMNS